MVLPIATILLPWDHPPTPIICVRQTLNLVTLHFLPVYKLYFIVTLHQIHDQAIITLNAGICDATPRCYFFIFFALETARQPTLCSTTAQWRSQCTPKTSVLARLTQYWRNKGMTWNARCLCCLVVFAQWTKNRLIYFGNLWGNQDPLFGIILKIHQNFFCN